MNNPIAERFARLSTERKMKQNRSSPVARPQAPQPGMMYTGGTPFFDERTGQPVDRTLTIQPFQPNTPKPEKQLERINHHRLMPRPVVGPDVSPEERLQQYSWQNMLGNMNLAQLLSALQSRRGF